MEPLVSVIIPTRSRPLLVVRAVRSALAQTLRSIEVIVVIDGADEDTERALTQTHDPRLRVEVLPAQLGCPAARNAGVNLARGRWVAFLDDDDEWLAQKLQVQIPIAENASCSFPIISCRLIARSDEGDLIYPRRFPRANEPLCEYIFCQSGLIGGEGFVLPSTVLTTRELLQRVPFPSGLMRHDDLDWLLRAGALKGAGVEFVPASEPLVIWHIKRDHSRLSQSTDWRTSLRWIHSSRHLVTPRAYAGFVLTWASVAAQRSGEWPAFFVLLREAGRHGRPRVIDVMAHLTIWLIPRRIRRRVVSWLDARRQQTPKPDILPSPQ
jgi:glycosyltransferase involved in cell wall biosynthesis